MSCAKCKWNDDTIYVEFRMEDCEGVEKIRVCEECYFVLCKTQGLYFVKIEVDGNGKFLLEH